MRRLKTSDIFSFARVVKASGIREDLVNYLQKLSAAEELDAERVGINTILMIIEALCEKKAENAIYEAIGPVLEKTTAEVQDMPPAELIACLKQLGEENDLKDFFGSLLGIVGRN